MEDNKAEDAIISHAVFAHVKKPKAFFQIEIH